MHMHTATSESTTESTNDLSWRNSLSSAVCHAATPARLHPCVVPIFRYLRYLSNPVSGFSRRPPEGAEGGDLQFECQTFESNLGSSSRERAWWRRGKASKDGDADLCSCGLEANHRVGISRRLRWERLILPGRPARASPRPLCTSRPQRGHSPRRRRCQCLPLAVRAVLAGGIL